MKRFWWKLIWISCKFCRFCLFLLLEFRVTEREIYWRRKLEQKKKLVPLELFVNRKKESVFDWYSNKTGSNGSGGMSNRRNVFEGNSKSMFLYQSKPVWWTCKIQIYEKQPVSSQRKGKKRDYAIQKEFCLAFVILYLSRMYTTQMAYKWVILCSREGCEDLRYNQNRKKTRNWIIIVTFILHNLKKKRLKA